MLARLLIFQLLLSLPGIPQTQQPEIAVERVRRFQAKGDEVSVKRVDRTTLRGRIGNVGPDSFSLRDKKTSQTTEVKFTDVQEIRKAGLSKGGKALVIAAGVAGATLLVFCAAPYPIGFLCRKDPS